MENRKKLHEYGLVLVILGICNLFMFVGDIVAGIVKGEMAAAFAAVDPGILLPVKIVYVVFCVILGLLVFADILIGIKAMKVSKNPTASKGYIVVAKIFLVVTCIAAIFGIINVFGGTSSAIDSGMDLAKTALDICIYSLFVQSADAVRKDVLNEKK